MPEKITQFSHVKNEYPCFSKQEALALTSGNKNLANELTDMLIAELPEFRNDIKTAMEANNIYKLKKSTHKLHGASRCCGTPALREAASQLESILNNNHDDKIKSALDRVLHEIDRLVETTPDNLYL